MQNILHKATPKNALFPVSRRTTFLKNRTLFLANVPPFFFQLVALFLAVAVLGMCSKTTDSHMHVHDSTTLWRATCDTFCTMKGESELGVLHCCSASGGYWVVSQAQKFRFQKNLNRHTYPAFFPPWLPEFETAFCLLWSNVPSIVIDFYFQTNRVRREGI